MKKWGYLLSGILIGAIVATSGSAAAAQLKSLVGQKVTGELTVVVNGKELPSKGAVINGTTNAPVRALVDAVGGDLQLEGKTINITTITPSNDVTIIDKADQLVSLNIEREKVLKKISNHEESVELYESKWIPSAELAIKAANGAPESVKGYTERLEETKQEYEEVKSNLAELKAQLEAIDDKLAELGK
ncbi:PspA/IM30 family protein [Paenibacillus senegalimassiliensis]|uniref:PspA/IM30 family protein n=1 Tax=Paenibacillus senegalimassiliensis TaxID=1737426 RepID=UPI00073F6282|nr:hypothetical protein [Paenibacillus senegalimassiliensis]